MQASIQTQIWNGEEESGCGRSGGGGGEEEEGEEEVSELSG